MYFKLATLAAVFASIHHAHAVALNSPDIRNIEIAARTALTCGDPNTAIPLLRAFRPRSSDHFYTTSAGELQNAINSFGYSSEGSAGRVFATQELHSVPFFRLFSDSAGDHFYTTSEVERDNAANNLGYHIEGVAGFIYPDTDCGGQALFRLFNGDASDHFYTLSAEERDNAINEFGYSNEGVAGFIFPA